MLRIHDGRFATVFTQKLLVACAVFAVLDNILAVTLWTMKDYRFYNHASVISFRKNHYWIAYIGGDPELKIDYDHHAGYQAGLRTANISAEPALVTRADLTPEGGYQAAEYLLTLANPPTAIVCVNDLTAIGAMHVSHKHGLKAGRDIAIAGFDGIADAAHTQPPLTALDQPGYTIPRQLAAMVLALINGEPLVERQVKFQPRRLIRESTGG